MISCISIGPPFPNLFQGGELSSVLYKSLDRNQQINSGSDYTWLSTFHTTSLAKYLTVHTKNKGGCWSPTGAHPGGNRASLSRCLLRRTILGPTRTAHRQQRTHRWFQTDTHTHTQSRHPCQLCCPKVCVKAVKPSEDGDL